MSPIERHKLSTMNTDQFATHITE